METCFVELNGPKGNVIIGSLYRPPNTSTKEFLEKYKVLISEICKEKHEIILGMDHNLDLLKLAQHKATEEFLECNLDCGMIPQITKPTRITQTSATLIDNVIVSKRLSGHSESRILIENISDHLPSLVSIGNYKCTQSEELKIYSRDIRKNNIEKLKIALQNKNWELELNPYRNNLDIMTEKFQRVLGEAIDHFTPYKERTINQKQLRKERWLTGALMISINKGKKLYKKSISRDASLNDKKKYNDYMLVLRKVKRYAKKKFYLDKCVEFKSNTRELWRTINHVLGRNNDKSTCITKLRTENLIVTRQKDIANELGDYFSTVGEKFAKKTLKSAKNIDDYMSLILRNNKSIFLVATNTHEISKLIDKLLNKKSSGYDNLDNVLLKKIKDEIALPLSLIFNESLSKGIFPSCMKLGEVVPLYKNKDRSDKSNYRPISLLLTTSKLLEKIVYKRVYGFLNETNQLYCSQYDFRTGHSCNQAVCELIGKISKNIERDWTTICVFLDLSKAFDTLEHSAVLQKLDRYGIRGNALDWFRSYLSNRTIRVKIQKTKSKEFPINYGTPQGSCLGPLIFLIFCNDLNMHLKHMQCIQFADDTTLYLGHPDPILLKNMIEHDLRVLQDWFRANKLTLNVEKSVCLIFNDKYCRKENINMILTLSGKNIPVQTETKFLGVWIDKDLKWDRHVNEITTRVNLRQCLLRRGVNFLTRHAKKILFFAQVQCLFSYGIGAWGNMINRSQQKKLQTIQNKCTRLIDQKCNVAETRKTHNILSINELTKLENYKLWYRKQKNSLPENLLKQMRMDHQSHTIKKVHNYETRNKKQMNLPTARSNAYRTSFLFKGLRDFQLLPNDIKHEQHESHFIRKCKQRLLADR